MRVRRFGASRHLRVHRSDATLPAPPTSTPQVGASAAAATEKSGRVHSVDEELAMQRQRPSNRRERAPLRVPNATTKKRRLATSESEDEAKRLRYGLLRSAFGPEDQVDETNWLTGTLIDLMLWEFAELYPDVHFLPTAFYHFHLEEDAWRHGPRGRRTKRDDYQIRDVLGRAVDYDSDRPLVFIVNVAGIHWNLFRVQLQPTPKLQLFEPMGRLASRTGISYRSVPPAVIAWLDTCYPQHKGWLARTVSAITTKQQFTGFDCGVACLLYADKCGRGQSGEEINDEIDQQAITTFRKQLQLQLQLRAPNDDRDEQLRGDGVGGTRQV